MRTYRVTNRETRRTYDIQAKSARAACESLGWHVGRCYIQEIGSKREEALKEVKRADVSTTPAHEPECDICRDTGWMEVGREWFDWQAGERDDDFRLEPCICEAGARVRRETGGE